MNAKVKSIVSQMMKSFYEAMNNPLIGQTDQDDFGHYHPEPEERTNFRTPKSTDLSRNDSGSVGHHHTATIWGWDSNFDDDWDNYGYTPEIPEKKELKCECGSDAIKAQRHSDWCPKYRKVRDE